MARLVKKKAQCRVYKGPGDVLLSLLRRKIRSVLSNKPEKNKTFTWIRQSRAAGISFIIKAAVPRYAEAKPQGWSQRATAHGVATAREFCPCPKPLEGQRTRLCAQRLRPP